MNKILDLIALAQIPLGFLLGLVILLILEFFQVGFLVSVAVLFAVALIYATWEYISDMLSPVRLIEWLFATESERKNFRKIEERDRAIGRIAVPLGMVLAFGAAQIWSPLAITEALF